MHSSIIDTPVLIIGGGPTGSAMAIELGWRGIPCTVIEQSDGSVDHPRLGIILTRTMEFCRRWGIVDRIYNCGFNNDYALNVVYSTSMTGYLLGRDRNESCNQMQPPAQSPEKRQRCPQMWFNPILETAAREYATTDYRLFHTLEHFQDEGDHVLAHCVNTQTGKKVTFRSQYMVACDGSASGVRTRLGIEMLGKPVLSYSMNIFIRAPELLSMHDKGAAERYIFVGPGGTWANLTVVDGRELWRITIIGSEQMMNLDTFDAHNVVQRCMGNADIPFEILSVKPWRRSELTAEHFRRGRIFLAGDAAHTMSPTGGHGMSTGVADAVDLGWKLEGVLKGWAPDGLLDSYQIERRPIAALVAAASANNFRAWVSVPNSNNILDPGPDGDSCRQLVGAHMLKAGREDWDSLGLQLGYRYDDSPVCIPDGTPAPPVTALDYHQTTRPGARAPHAWISEGKSTLDLFGRQFVLLSFSREADLAPLEAAAGDTGVPFSAVFIDNPDIAELYERKLVLVRPDGFVAWRGDTLPANTAELIDTVRGCFVSSLAATA